MIRKKYLEEKFPTTFEYFSKVGLSTEEFFAYITLVTKGQMKVSDLSNVLEMDRTKVYRLLKNLEKFAAVEIVRGHPIYYKSAPLDELLSRIVSSKEHELNNMKDNMSKAIESFKSNISINDDSDYTQVGFRFRFIEGDPLLLSEALKIIRNTKNELKIAVDKFTFLKFHRSDLLPAIVECIDRGVSVSMVSEDDQYIRESVKKYQGDEIVRFFHYNFYPVFLVSDKSELIVVMDTGSRNSDTETTKVTLGFWCSSIPFATRMASMFDYIWERLAIDIT